MKVSILKGGFVVLKGTKWNSCCLIRRDEYCKNKPEGGGRVWFRRRRKAGFVMRASQYLDTDLNWISDVVGICKRICVRRCRRRQPYQQTMSCALLWVAATLCLFLTIYIWHNNLHVTSVTLTVDKRRRKCDYYMENTFLTCDYIWLGSSEFLKIFGYASHLCHLWLVDFLKLTFLNN